MAKTITQKVIEHVKTRFDTIEEQKPEQAKKNLVTLGFYMIYSCAKNWSDERKKELIEELSDSLEVNYD